MDIKHQYGSADVVPYNGLRHKWRVVCWNPNGRHHHTRHFKHESQAKEHAEGYMSLAFLYYKQEGA